MLSFDKFHFSARGSLLSVARAGENLVLNSLHNGGTVPIMEFAIPNTIKEEFFPWELKLLTDKETHKICLFGKDGACFAGTGSSPCLKYIYMKGVYNANYVYEGHNTVKICDCFTNTFHVFKIHKGKVVIDAQDSERRIYKEYIKITVLPDENGEYISENHSCYGLRDQIGVLCDGTVVPCCLDADGAIPLGNIFENTLEEILSSKRAMNLKNSFINKHVCEELCKKCEGKIIAD